ncbi:GxxExxY protein [Flavobacterium phragmitis]|uniref:GxxExxY protein n=1 Tax=Flavobacterium phragmitis TaxID=739143 RepID=A0A1I1PKF3_9FLAO|nr:GxxExxY protein [Flavobacterium phragmitis]SFD10216.1 GxxExxY protein [Flavobacterium phragmitis]
MEVHRILGGGLLEIVYKDALEYEFRKHNIPFEREKEYNIQYKDIVLAHKFYADFVVYDEIILEIKASKDIIDEYTAQTINYLKLADSDLGIIVNFSKKSLQHKRVIH